MTSELIFKGKNIALKQYAIRLPRDVEVSSKEPPNLMPLPYMSRRGGAFALYPSESNFNTASNFEAILEQCRKIVKHVDIIAAPVVAVPIAEDDLPFGPSIPSEYGKMQMVEAAFVPLHAAIFLSLRASGISLLTAAMAACWKALEIGMSEQTIAEIDADLFVHSESIVTDGEVRLIPDASDERAAAFAAFAVGCFYGMAMKEATDDDGRAVREFNDAYNGITGGDGSIVPDQAHDAMALIQHNYREGAAA